MLCFNCTLSVVQLNEHNRKLQKGEQTAHAADTFFLVKLFQPRIHFCHILFILLLGFSFQLPPLCQLPSKYTLHLVPSQEKLEIYAPKPKFPPCVLFFFAQI